MIHNRIWDGQSMADSASESSTAAGQSIGLKRKGKTPMGGSSTSSMVSLPIIQASLKLGGDFIAPDTQLVWIQAHLTGHAPVATPVANALAARVVRSARTGLHCCLAQTLQGASWGTSCTALPGPPHPPPSRHWQHCPCGKHKLPGPGGGWIGSPMRGGHVNEE